MLGVDRETSIMWTVCLYATALAIVRMRTLTRAQFLLHARTQKRWPRIRVTLGMDAAAANLPGPSHAVLAPNPIPPGGRRRGGYDCEFVEAPAAAFQTECPICLQVLKEPCVISCPCGQKICHECIEVIKAVSALQQL